MVIDSALAIDVIAESAGLLSRPSVVDHHRGSPTEPLAHAARRVLVDLVEEMGADDREANALRALCGIYPECRGVGREDRQRVAGSCLSPEAPLELRSVRRRTSELVQKLEASLRDRDVKVDDETGRLSDDAVGRELLRLRRVIGPVAPSANFHFVTISGVSASGKDSLLNLIEERFPGRREMETLEKLMTRPPRLTEPNYATSLTEGEFARRSHLDEIVLQYQKRGVSYGFDGRQFSKAWSEGKMLFSIFTDFDLVPATSAMLRSLGARVSTVFIDVPQSTLLRRTLSRNFDAEQVRSRSLSIRRDFLAIERRTSFREEYTFVANSDFEALEAACDELVDAIGARPH